MVSSGAISGISSDISSGFSELNSYLSELSGSWKGSSYDSLISQAEEFAGEFESVISSQLQSFQEALEAYDKYKRAKNNLKTAESNYSMAIQNEDGEAVNRFQNDINRYRSEMNSLKATINSALTSASGPQLEATSISSSSKGEFVNYYQTDYPNVQYSDYGTIATYGCGPTALAMVLTYLLDEEITPIETAQKGYNSQVNYTCEKGTYWSYFGAMAEQYGVSCEQMEMSKDNIINNLNDDKTLILIMGPGDFTKSGHFIVARGIDDDGKIVVADPASRKRSEQTWSVDTLVSQGSQIWALDNE